MARRIAEEFADWWDAVRFHDPWFGWGVSASFARWWSPRNAELTEAMEEEVLDELEARGMIVTDPWAWLTDDRPPSDGDRAQPSPRNAA